MSKKKIGRPKKKIDYRLLDEAIKLQCTREECSRLLNVDEKTLDARLREDKKSSFSTYFALKAGYGKMALRRKQFKLADRNANMAIWLGKQWLGQRDKLDLNERVVYQQMGRVIKDDGTELHFDVGEDPKEK